MCAKVAKKPVISELDVKFDSKMEGRLEQVLTSLSRLEKMGRGQWTKVADHKAKYGAVVRAVREQVNGLLSSRGGKESLIAGIYKKYGKGGEEEEEEESEEEEEED